MKSAAALHAALADPTRESIVRLLAEGERSVGEIAERLPVSRRQWSTVKNLVT